jgi:CMP-N,N'-diacetyllegionaminic acid synthase
MNIYSIIPARGGSKGIPKKNIKLLNNLPLIDYTIKYSIKSDIIRKTIVSTDSEEILQIAKISGAEVPFLRPFDISQDDTQDYPVLKHALCELENIYKEEIDLLVLLRPTSPFRPIGLIELGIKMMIQNPKATSLMSVAISKEHPYRQWLQNSEFIVGYEKNVFESYNIPRQLLPKVYFQTGDIEIIRRSTILEGSISGSNILPLIIEHDQMLDVDTENDWKKLNAIRI